MRTPTLYQMCIPCLSLRSFCLTGPPLHTLAYSKLVPSFCSCQKAAGKEKRITKMWGVYSWEYFSQNFMSENCRVVNQQDIHRDRDRDREICLYWAICNMIWKLSWCAYGNCFVNPITKTKIAPSSHSPISTKLALLWSALPKCLKLYVSVCVWQVILSPWYYPLHVMCSFGRHHTGMFTEEQSWENWSHFHWCLQKKGVEKYLQFLNIFLKFLWKSESEWNSEEIN